MKNTSTLLTLLLTLVASNSFATTLTGSPSSAKLTIYGVALSKNTDCSQAKVVGYNPEGTTYDFLQNPNIVSGSIDPGTYQCVILYMKALLTFVPATTVGTCTAGQTISRAICNGGCSYTSGSPDADNILQFGSVQTSAATNSQDTAHADKVFLFISTGSAGDGSTGLAFQQPLTAGSPNGIKLNGALTVASSGGTGTFVVDFNNALNGGTTPCDLGPPTFSFR